MSAVTKPTNGAKTQELGHVRVFQVPIDSIYPSPENDKVYKPVNSDDPEIRELANSIRRHGIKEELVVTEDDWILSGHRRYAAAKLAGLADVPVRIEPIRREDNLDGFVVLLREYNRQRDKTADEKLREELVTVDPDEAYQSLIDYRERQSQIPGDQLQINGRKRRARITPAKRPFLDAIRKVVDGRRKFWPLSVRQVHYALLNDPPLKNANRENSSYRNDQKSYKALSDLATRARLTNEIPMAAIADETRPVTVWNVFPDSRQFVRQQLDDFLKNYWRNLMQSQPNHVEIVAEKNTILSILRSVAMKYCIPLTSGRGYCSLPPRHQVAERYRKSCKEKLVLLMLSDFDPDEEEIAQSFARSMRDDFGIRKIHPVKVALTAEQVQKFDLPPILKAKKKSSNYSKFSQKHGDNVFELEAVSPETLQELLTDAIDSVIDAKRFNAELDADRQDAAFLQGVRQTVHAELQNLDFGGEQS